MEPNIDNENKDQSLDNRLSGQLMKLKDFVLHHSSNEERLMEIAAKIRPLPQSITPSAPFLAQMRQRLLHLGDGQAAQKAA
ncbi:MAG: hypothetical protein GEU75_12960 [Dehalococcoidia bacterium]|nr:hypothetical protein [Dehalococcoidia bacterium]